MPGRGLRALIVEDSVADADLLVHALNRGGFDVSHRRVDTDAGLRDALSDGRWDVILCDYEIPGFGAPQALATFHSLDLDLPFIIVSGVVGEDAAVDALKAGAHDFIVKGRWARLPAAIERELHEAGVRSSRRAAERALRQSEERFRTLVSSMNDLVFTFDREQRCTGVFGSWPKSSTFSPQDFIGKRVSEMRARDTSTVHEEANTRALSGQSVLYEYLGVTTSHHYQSSLAPMRDEQGGVSGVVAVIRDISRLKRLESELLAADRLAAVGLLATGLRHDLNNAVTALTVNLEMLADDASGPGASSDSRALLADAKAAADRLRSIGRDLKVLSWDEDIEAAVDVEGVLDSAAHLAESDVQRGIEVLRHYDAVPPVRASRSKLGQLLMGLIALIARSGRGTTRAPRSLRLSIRQHESGRVAVAVASDVMLREDPQTEASLAVCRRLAEALGSELTVEGSEFRLLLVPAEARHAEPGPVARQQTPGQRGKVLIVDDQKVLATSLARLLAPQHDVETATAGHDVLGLLQVGRRYNVILSDLMMPAMSGMELYAEIHRLDPHQAECMVFMTGGAFSVDARAFLEGVPNLRLEKPFSVRQLLELINARMSAAG